MVAKCPTRFLLSKRNNALKIFIVFLLVFTIILIELSSRELDNTSQAPSVVTVLHSALYPTEPSNSRRIFFHETSGRGCLSFRQSCTIESAAKHNPLRPIELYISADRINDTKPWLGMLRRYGNVAVKLVNNDQFFRASPFRAWYDKGEWRNSRFKTAHISDYIRLISLYESGGFYLDLDYVVLKPLDEKSLHNFLLVEGMDAKQLNNGVIHFEARHRLVKELIKFLAAEYDPDDYYLHGPTALTHIYHKLCASSCADVKVLSHNYFCPIGPPFWHLYFEDSSKYSLSLLNNSYGVHMWNFLSANETIRIGTKQMYAVLAAEHCPVTASHYDDFQLH